MEPRHLVWRQGGQAGQEEEQGIALRETLSELQVSLSAMQTLSLLVDREEADRLEETCARMCTHLAYLRRVVADLEDFHRI